MIEFLFSPNNRFDSICNLKFDYNYNKRMDINSKNVSF